MFWNSVGILGLGGKILGKNSQRQDKQTVLLLVFLFGESLQQKNYKAYNFVYP